MTSYKFMGASAPFRCPRCKRKRNLHPEGETRPSKERSSVKPERKVKCGDCGHEWWSRHNVALNFKEEKKS